MFYIRCCTSIILWHIDPLLGNDRETSSYTTAGFAKKHGFTERIRNSNRGTVFSVRFVPRYYKQDS
jgi:hypothetical protein